MIIIILYTINVTFPYFLEFDVPLNRRCLLQHLWPVVLNHVAHHRFCRPFLNEVKMFKLNES